MELKKVNQSKLKLFKVLLYINTFVILGLGVYYVAMHVFQHMENNFFDSYVFLPLFLMFIGFEIMLMSVVYYNASYKSDYKQDSAMFKLGIIIEIVAFITIFICILINHLVK